MNTVKEYIQNAKASNLLMEALLALEDPVLEGRLNPGNPAYKDERGFRSEWIEPSPVMDS